MADSIVCGASSAAKEYTNALSDMPEAALQAGNTAPCHTRQVFRQAASELRGERRLDDDPIREMRIQMASWLAWEPRDGYGVGDYLQAIGDTPYYSVHNMMVKFIEKDFARWPSLLAGISLAYNSTVHTSTGFAPHELFYSFPPSCPFDIVVEADRTEAASGADQYALETTDRRENEKQL